MNIKLVRDVLKRNHEVSLQELSVETGEKRGSGIYPYRMGIQGKNKSCRGITILLRELRKLRIWSFLQCFYGKEIQVELMFEFSGYQCLYVSNLISSKKINKI